MLVAAADRLAYHLAAPEVASEFARGPAAGAFHAIQANDASLYFERGRILHGCHPADHGCTRPGRADAVGRGKRHPLGLSASDLGPGGRGLAHELGPDASGQIAARHVAGRRVVIVADPNSDDDVGRETDEPGIAVVLARAGLSRSGSDDPDRPSRALADDAGEHIEHGSAR